jgi:hypothetical protein
MRGLLSSKRAVPTNSTRMVVTTAGQKMPATHCGKVAPRPRVDDAISRSWMMPVTTAATKKTRAGTGKKR